MISRWLVPPRQRGTELLDLAETPDSIRLAAMRDVERSNALLGGSAAVRAALRALRPSLPPSAILLDVATGTADIVASLGWEPGRRPWVAGLDLSPALLLTGRRRLDAAVAGSALRLPFRDASVDVALCSQALHHFFDADMRQLVAELHRVSRGHVVICDIRRSRLAAAGFWLAATALRFHPVTRRDGVVSVSRGFTSGELGALVREVTGVTPAVRRHPFFRLSVTWPAHPA